MRILALLALIGVCAVTGCGMTTTATYQVDAPANVKTVAVLVLDDSKLSDAGSDYFAFGYTPESNSGLVVAKFLGQSLESQGLYDVIRGTELSRRCMEKNLKYRKLHRMPPTEAARLLGVDGVVTGEMLKYRQSWFLFISRAKVAFNAQCHEATSGKPVWTATAEGSRVLGIESDLALELCQEISRKIARQAPPKP